MDLPTLQLIVEGAVERLIVDQWELHFYDVGERTITSQLFRYMSEHGRIPSELRVDHEYNRHEGATKTIRSRVADDELDPSGEMRILPDVVVHRRGEDDQNWLVIEAKRGYVCDLLDRVKVEALIDQYGYRWGALLAFGIDRTGWHPSCEWIGRNGREEAGPLFDEWTLERLNLVGEENWDRRRGA
jgi:hypothetical protein